MWKYQISPIQMLLISRKPNTGSNILSFFFFQVVFTWGFQTQWKRVQIQFKAPSKIHLSSRLCSPFSSYFLPLFHSSFLLRPSDICVKKLKFSLSYCLFIHSTTARSLLLHPKTSFLHWPIFPHVELSLNNIHLFCLRLLESQGKKSIAILPHGNLLHMWKLILSK